MLISLVQVMDQAVVMLLCDAFGTDTVLHLSS